MRYYVYFSDEQGPVTGLTPSWKGVSSADNGVDKTSVANSGVSISEISSANAPGWYGFDITYGQLPWDVIEEDLVGVIDGGSSLADVVRYKPICVTLRGLALARIAHKAVQDKSTGNIDIFKVNGVGREMSLQMSDDGSEFSRIPAVAE